MNEYHSCDPSKMETQMMKITFDKKANALAIVFKNGRVSKDNEITHNIFAGFDRVGELVEIQILDISKADRPWFTVEAAAKYLNKSERTILRWIELGKLKPKKIGREYRISPEDLEKLAS
jgi:excisionase family DNA binding protein